MTLLDRFRPQPRQKHADPAVRLAFVEEIPIDERELLADMARDDADPRVRRAAVAKLMDPAVLAAVARSDAADEVREEALGMLRDIALDRFDGLAEADAVAAVEAIADVKTLAAIAKTAAHGPVAIRALERVTDERAVGSIARHAQVELVRLAAFERLHDAAEIVSVALNSEHKDTATAAVERLTDRADLEQVASRGRSKNAVKRARGRLRAMDEEAAAAAVPPGVDPPKVAADPMPVTDPSAARPPAESIEEARGPHETDAPFTPAADDARPQPDAAGAASQAEAPDAAHEPEDAAPLGEGDAGERSRLAELAEQERQKETEKRRGRLAELADEAEAAAADGDLTAARRRLTMVRGEWKDLCAGLEVEPSLGERYAAAEARLAARDAAAREEDARRRDEGLARVQQFMARIAPLLDRPDLTLKAADRALRDVRSALSTLPPLPAKRDHDDMVGQLKAAQHALTTRARELREAAEWRQWANVGVQEQLCARMEALAALHDIEEIAQQVRNLQQQWRQAADVPRAQAAPLWERFKAAHDVVWTRCEAYFAVEAGARAANLAGKLALCERAEALADSTSWVQTADELKRLQAEWKSIGPVTRGQEKITWDRFRTACDRFFTRRQTDLADRKKVWAANLAKKDALAIQAEGLAESTDWEAAAAAIRGLQAEWKAIGPVKKSRSEALWQRFRGACDRFFARYAERHDIARREHVAAREAICAELEALAPPPPASIEGEAAAPDTSSPPVSGAAPVEPPADLLGRVRALHVRWHREIAARGVDRERAAALDQRFAAALARLIARWPRVFAGSDLDADTNRQRMETLVRRMEDLAASLGVSAGAPVGDTALAPAVRLAAMLKEALAANTIGGKVDEDTRMRAAVEEVRQAQANWSRIGPTTPGEVRRGLSDRFHRACRQIAERAGRAVGTGRAVKPDGQSLRSGVKSLKPGT